MKKTAFIVAGILFPAMVNAGWMVESRSSDGDSRKTYIEGDLLCDESDGDHTIIDMKSRQIAFVNHKSKTYASSTMDELKKGVAASRELLDKTMAENMKNMPPEQQASYKQMMGSRDAKKPDVKIQKSGVEKVAGFNASKYQIYTNNKLVEEIWTSSDVPFFSGGFGASMSETATGIGGSGYTSDKGYLEIMKSGYPLKQRTLDTMGMEGMPAVPGMQENWTTEEVKSIQKMDVTKYVNVPSGYRKLTYMEFMQGADSDQ